MRLAAVRPSRWGVVPFGMGFRAFFLAAGLAGVLLQALWIAALRGLFSVPAYYDVVASAVGWHAHEMLFGYVVAVVAGFLLTAVRNWTGLDTATGGRLLVLLALWLAGRVAPFLAGSLPAGWVAALDLAFLPALTLVLAIPLVRRAKPRNLLFVPLLSALTLANLLIHLQALGITAKGARLGTYLAVDLIVLLIAIIAGRVLPLFLRSAVPGSQPRSWPLLEAISIASVVALAILRPFADGPLPLGLARAVAAVAAVCHMLRIWGWCDARIRAVPLLWVLFVGYAWLVAGFALLALSPLFPLGPLASLHAFTAGAMGTLTLGMMARISLGHTGRPLVPPRAVVMGFASISLAAVLRVLVPLLMPQAYPALLTAAGLFWVAAFLLFVVSYAPILVRPRADGRPG